MLERCNYLQKLMLFRFFQSYNFQNSNVVTETDCQLKPLEFRIKYSVLFCLKTFNLKYFFYKALTIILGDVELKFNNANLLSRFNIKFHVKNCYFI